MVKKNFVKLNSLISRVFFLAWTFFFWRNKIYQFFEPILSNIVRYLDYYNLLPHWTNLIGIYFFSYYYSSPSLSFCRLQSKTRSPNQISKSWWWCKRKHNKLWRRRRWRGRHDCIWHYTSPNSCGWSIHGGRASPFSSLPFFAATSKGAVIKL